MLTMPTPLRMATHEAGHAVFAHAHGIPVLFMTIDLHQRWPPLPNIPAMAGPVTLYDTLAFTTFRQMVLIELAGIAAQTVFSCEDWPDLATLRTQSIEWRRVFGAMRDGLSVYNSDSAWLDQIALQSLEDELNVVTQWLGAHTQRAAVQALAQQLVAQQTMNVGPLSNFWTQGAYTLQPLL